MDKKRLKRIIVREGLIILGFVIAFTSVLFSSIPAESLLNDIVLSVIIIGYPFYLFIRFIIWMIKKNRIDVEQRRTRWYHKPLHIYYLAFIFGAFTIPLAWMTPLISKDRKMFFSLTMLLCPVLVFSKRIPKIWPLFYLVSVLLWFIKTEKSKV